MIELKKYFDYILDNYLLPENKDFSGNKDYFKVICSIIPSEISKIYDNKKYKIYGSCGKGGKSASPYVAITDRKITTSTQKGIYVDFIFKSDMSGFYLTIDQGITNIKEKYGNKKSKEIAQKAASYFRNNLQELKGFKANLIPENVKNGSLEEEYGNTRVIAKYYEKNKYTNEEIINDLKTIMLLYEEIKKNIGDKNYDEIIEKIASNNITTISNKKDNTISWEEVYKEIALKVLEYKNNHQGLTDLMYEMLEEANLFSDDDKKNCSLDTYNGKRCRYDDFDPFSFMNRFDVYIKEGNREKLIKLFQEKTGLDVRIPSNFDGVPRINAQKSCFIAFKDYRKENDVNDLWNLFETSINYQKTQTEKLKSDFIKYYDLCIPKQGIKYNLSIGLFRIDPSFYCPLDSTNREYLKKVFNIRIKNVPTGSEYLELIELIKNKIDESNDFTSIVDFSKKAWDYKKSKKIKYWTYSAGENGECWKDCLENDCMYLGWDEIGDYSQYSSKSEIIEAIKEKCPDSCDNPTNSAKAVFEFKNSIEPGDIIIAKIGSTKLLGYGEVTDEYYSYDENRKLYKNVRNVSWIKEGEWNLPIKDKVAQKTLTNITDYEGFADRLISIMEGEDNMPKVENEWIIPANPKLYDHEGAFDRFGFIDWSQNVNFKIGDIVYVYAGEPESRIVAKTVVEKINMKQDEVVDDSEFVLSDKFTKTKDRYTRLKLLSLIEDEKLNYKNLINHGLWGRPQSAGRIPEELSKYISSVLNGDEIFDSINAIYYGGPGCGKSKLVDDKYCKDDNYVRTTFYPDYTNSDFVGQLVPKYNKELDKLTYVINPGYFTQALEKALANPNRNIYLIIEEINRGNAAAIFGDIFQLLDRVNSNSKKADRKIGESEYSINNSIIEDYIKEKLNIDLNGEIRIPPNMSIIATMNTSDQNVYTLDSAFKRRWKMIHISNEFTDEEYDTIIGSAFVPMKNCDITWKEFVDKINDAIININTFGINSEDKQIGKYFVGTCDLIEKENNDDDSKNISIEKYDNFKDASKAFSEKVLMYLWEDIAKLKRDDWFDSNIKTMDALLKEYAINGIKVFSSNIQSILNPNNDGASDE